MVTTIARVVEETVAVVNEPPAGSADGQQEEETADVPEPIQTAVIAVVPSQPLRSGVRTVVGSVTVGDLAPRLAVAIRDFLRKEGYQRDPSRSRVNQLGDDLKRRLVDLPTAILLNIRSEEFDESMIVERAGQLVLELGDVRLWAVDGQHRGLSLVQRCFLDDPERWAAFRISACIMLGATEDQEMEQFHVVNSTAKSVPTDLALDLLKHRTEIDPSLWKVLDERGQSWKVEAEALTEALASTPVWKGRIRFPGLPKSDTVIGSSSMVTSLRPLLQMAYFQMLAKPRQVSVVDAFWQGVRNVLPGVFHAPEAHALMKSTGVMAMHSLIVPVLEIASRGRNDTDPEVYEEIMRDALMDLEGSNSAGRLVRGPDFWLSGPEGAAGTFSSNAGRRVLLGMLRRRLPKLASAEEGAPR
jgi:DGQHR domain-containing protein